MIRTFIFAAAALGAALTSVQAEEQSASYDRAELADPAIRYERIVDAAEDACRKALRGSPFYHYKFRPCVSAAVGAAVAEIDAPSLTAYADGETARRRLAPAS